MADNVFSTSEPKGNRVQTTSAFRMWWLTRLKGYRVVLVKRAPELNSFGQIRYRVFWLMEPPNGSPTSPRH
jgi:putative hemolysin